MLIYIIVNLIYIYVFRNVIKLSNNRTAKGNYKADRRTFSDALLDHEHCLWNE